MYLSGQVSHDGTTLVAPAPVDAAGRATGTGNTAARLRQCCTNPATLPHRFGASLDDVVEEVIHAIDVTGRGGAGQKLSSTARPPASASSAHSDSAAARPRRALHSRPVVPGGRSSARLSAGDSFRVSSLNSGSRRTPPAPRPGSSCPRPGGR
ncbi:RidA family protein [Streptomyces sp. NPDC059853]|uniref:RidA family protein n=1 Tax=Streptomyces sp. NPDC059853 TaxID=3346973 RepID=UPI00365F41AC